MAHNTAAGQPQTDVRNETQEGNVHALCFSFNQDSSSFVCGTTAGFRVYTTQPLCEVRKRESSESAQSPKAQASPGGVSFVRMLFKTNIFPMTLADSMPGDGPLKIKIWDESKGQFIAELRAKQTVTGIAVNKEVIAMVCMQTVNVYRSDNIKNLVNFVTVPNERGLCALASAAKPWVLVCPGQTIGSLRVQVCEDDSASCVIPDAHKSDLGCLAVNASGTLVASASDYGTVVKVFSRNGELMHSLRRGMRPVTISCLAFRADDRFLAVGSSARTVHVFRIDVEQTAREREDCENKEEISIKAVGESVLGALAAYALEPTDFARFRIPETDTADIRSSCSRVVGPQVGFRGNEPVLLVLHHNGIFYEVGFDENVQAGCRTQECSCPAPTTWFAVRPDFKLMAPSAKVPTVAGGATEEDEEAEEWQLV